MSLLSDKKTTKDAVKVGKRIAATHKKKLPDSLKSCNFISTSIDRIGVESLLREFKNINTLKVNDGLWNDFLSSFADSGPGCFDCVGANPRLTSCNLTRDVAPLLPALLELFPGIEHLVLEGLGEDVRVVEKYLPEFNHVKTLTLKNTDLKVLAPVLEKWAIGERLTTLLFAGAQATIDVTLMDRLCPNIVILGITNSMLTRTRPQSETFLQNLRTLKLWDVKTGSDPDIWRDMLKSAKNLEKLYLWSIVVTDDIFEQILSVNPFPHLEELKIGASETGMVRLTETTVTRLLGSCRKLNKIGGVCDWQVQDLVGLLQRVLVQGGWKIMLD